jgi:hypothetical protein
MGQTGAAATRDVVHSRSMERNADGIPIVALDDDGENWMQQYRLERLRARGWTGTVREWVKLCNELGSDPLKQDPPIVAAR